MREHPILFSDEMVRAILEGRKTQTRRVVKPQPEWNGARWVWPIPKRAQRPSCATKAVSASREWHAYLPPNCCPYGSPGDRLWVRECWCPRGDGQLAVEKIQRPFYRATDGEGDTKKPASWRWRPSIHMPRWACRLLLEVTDVRVERVQEIGEEDCYAEGRSLDLEMDPVSRPAAKWFRDLWDSINAKRGHSWESDPWVWVVSFRRVEP